jgi:hypothetical protein
VLLVPIKETQGREMTRKIWIASALALAVLLAAAPAAALAGSPLLSGYGPPGAGEQAILGSTLLQGPHGGAGQGGSSGSGGSGGPVSGSGTSTSRGTGPARTGPAGRSSSSAGGHAGIAGASQAHGAAGAEAGRSDASLFVYPSSLRSSSAGSPALGISGGDLLLLAGTIAALALLGTLTIRLTHLQR